MGDALSAVEKIYFSIQASLHNMLAACTTQAERDDVVAKYVAARQNYWSCINRSFHEDDPAVKALVAEARKASDSIGRINEHLGQISKVIGYLTDAVSIGSQIAAKVITL